MAGVMYKAKKIVKNVRMIILIVVLVLMIFSIHPNFEAEGVAIRSVVKDSAAHVAGIASPDPKATPLSREVILSIDSKTITDVKDFFEVENALDVNRTVRIETDKNVYRVKTRPLLNITVTDELINVTINETIDTIEEINGTNVTVQKNVSKIITQNKTLSEVIGVESLGLSIYDAPTTNIRKGLDLQGGTRVLLQPAEPISDDDMEILLLNMKERLNVYGLSDIIVRDASDLSGNQYILVEIAGATKQEVKDLLAKQGKFAAKIANETVFLGGTDITYVCRSAECSGLDHNYGCRPVANDAWACRFRFAIALTPDAAERHAGITGELDIINVDGSDYLEHKLDLYLDDEMVDSLYIGSELKGRETTDIAISGSGAGKTEAEAVNDALNGMKKLQTILITGSLPVKLNIVRTDAISATLGEEFTKNAIMVGLFAILAVVIVVYIRYRRFEVAIPMVFAMVSEVVLLLGLASLVGWNLDLAAIAGIIVAAGTGVDDQIVITDEVLRGEAQNTISWKERIKKAFFIIMAAYFTTVVAMVPLLFAGAGLLKGFAFVTIVGVSFGVFITRPAYAAVVEILIKK